MKFKIYFVILFTYSINLFAAEHLVQKNADDHGPDIPTVGSSLFDKLYSKKNSDGKVVYDFDNNLKGLVDKNQMTGDFIQVMFPFSRSLQRPQDLSYNPLLNPRVVFSPRGDKWSLVRGKLFFGFVEAKDQAEVISYNDEAGRFEYQLITELSTKPKVFYVNRGKCLTCHQGLAPIFSTPAWTDSSLGAMGTLLEAGLKLKDSNKEILVKRLFGTSLIQEQVGTFDRLVRESNEITRNERLWVHGCDTDNRCRLGLLLNTLARSSQISRDYINYSRSVVESSEFSKQRFFSSFLSAFDIGVSNKIREYGSVENIALSGDAIFEIITNLSILSDEDNPATKRPRPIAAKGVFNRLFGFLNSDRRVLYGEIRDVNEIAQILIDLYREDHSIFHKSAINKIKIMSVLLERAGSKKSMAYSQWIQKETPEKVLFKGHIQPIFKRKELNIFSKYCYSCHAVGLMFPPQFLIGTEEEVISKISALKPKILFKLENNLMPPNNIKREQLKKYGDYNRLIEYLNSLD